jgi:hypothetical protein
MTASFASSARDDSVAALCASLEARLRDRVSELAQAVRNYPTPIARCDDQLTGLLERRRRVREARNQLQALGADVGDGGLQEAASALAMLDACISALAPGDLDDAFATEFADALACLRDQWRARAGGCGPADAWANDGAPARVA